MRKRLWKLAAMVSAGMMIYGCGEGDPRETAAPEYGDMDVDTDVDSDTDADADADADADEDYRWVPRG